MSSKKQKLYSTEADASGSGAGGAEGDAPAAAPENPMANKVKGLLDDPEIQALIESNPKAQKAVEDLQVNPMNVMMYMGDPDLQPLVQAAMKKLGFGGM